MSDDILTDEQRQTIVPVMAAVESIVRQAEMCGRDVGAVAHRASDCHYVIRDLRALRLTVALKLAEARQGELTLAIAELDAEPCGGDGGCGAQSNTALMCLRCRVRHLFKLRRRLRQAECARLREALG